MNIFKYTGEQISPIENFNSEDDYMSQSSFIEKPCDVLYHIVENEVGLIDSVKYSNIETARANSEDIKCAFSLKEKVKARELIENICKDTNLFPLFKGTSDFSFTALKKQYSENDVDLVIKANDIIKYSFSRTPLTSVNTLVNVKYKIDYAEDEYREQTGYVDGYDMFGNGDGVVELNFT